MNLKKEVPGLYKKGSGKLRKPFAPKVTIGKLQGNTLNLGGIRVTKGTETHYFTSAYKAAKVLGVHKSSVNRSCISGKPIKTGWFCKREKNNKGE